MKKGTSDPTVVGAARAREPGCDYCGRGERDLICAPDEGVSCAIERGNLVVEDYVGRRTFSARIRFCPMCGRRLAWAGVNAALDGAAGAALELA